MRSFGEDPAVGLPRCHECRMFCLNGQQRTFKVRVLQYVSQNLALSLTAQSLMEQGCELNFMDSAPSAGGNTDRVALVDQFSEAFNNCGCVKTHPDVIQQGATSVEQMHGDSYETETETMPFVSAYIALLEGQIKKQWDSVGEKLNVQVCKLLSGRPELAKLVGLPLHYERHGPDQQWFAPLSPLKPIKPGARSMPEGPISPLSPTTPSQASNPFSHERSASQEPPAGTAAPLGGARTKPFSRGQASEQPLIIETQKHTCAFAAKPVAQKYSVASAAPFASHAAATHQQQPYPFNFHRHRNQLHDKHIRPSASAATKQASTTGVSPADTQSRSPALSDGPSFGQWQSPIEKPAGEPAARQQRLLAAATAPTSNRQCGSTAQEHVPLPREATSQAGNQRNVTIASWPPGKTIVVGQPGATRAAGFGCAADASQLSGARATEDPLQQVHKPAASSFKRYATRVPTESAVGLHEQGNVFQKSNTTAFSGSQLSAPTPATQHLQHSTEHSLLPKLQPVVSSPAHGAPVSGQLGSSTCSQEQVGAAAHGSRQQVASAVDSPVKQHMQPQTQGAQELNARSHLKGKPGGNSLTAELSRHHAAGPAEPAGHAMLQTQAAVSRLPAASLDGVNNVDKSGQHQALHGKAYSGSNQPLGKQAKCRNLNVIWAQFIADKAAAKSLTPDAAAKSLTPDAANKSLTPDAAAAKAVTPVQCQGLPPTASEALPRCSMPGNQVQSEASGVQSEASGVQSEAAGVQSEASGVHAYGAERLSREEWHGACCAADAARASAALNMLTAMQGHDLRAALVDAASITSPDGTLLYVKGRSRKHSDSVWQVVRLPLAKCPKLGACLLENRGTARCQSTMSQDEDDDDDAQSVSSPSN